jgi:glycerophosphoryl diester phosphodiesterase
MVEVIGHRGAAGYEPENTLRSFKKALEIGVDIVELDVHLTKDNKLVVIHDEKVDRTTNGKGYVKNYKLSELKKLDAGKGERIPTLQEAIDLLYGRVKVQIELKGENTEKPVVDFIKNYDPENFILTSFYHTRVKRAKELYPKITTGVLFVGRPIDPLKIVRDAKADRLCINYATIDKELVEEMHKNKIKVSVWNVDDVEYVKRMVSLKVDAIGSNKPDVVIDILKRIKSY